MIEDSIEEQAKMAIKRIISAISNLKLPLEVQDIVLGALSEAESAIGRNGPLRTIREAWRAMAKERDRSPLADFADGPYGAILTSKLGNDRRHLAAAYNKLAAMRARQDPAAETFDLDILDMESAIRRKLAGGETRGRPAGPMKYSPEWYWIKSNKQRKLKGLPPIPWEKYAK